MDDKIQDKFLHLVRYSIGADDTPPEISGKGEWGQVFMLAAGQALTGVCAMGIERMPDCMRPPLLETMGWVMATVTIERDNKAANGNCVKLAGALESSGTKSCLLKGQGVAMYYPNPLRRITGDIDLWLPGGHRKVMRMVHNMFPAIGARYHHVDFPVFPNQSVELHFTPSWMSAPWANWRLQRWFAAMAGEQFENKVDLPGDAGEVAVPTMRFNMVYLLLHIYRHFFDEGVGLRQLMDYHFLMTAFCGKAGDDERSAVVADLRRLGLAGFAGSVMFVLGELFHTPADLMIVPPSGKRGRFVLSEVLKAGNFGLLNSSIDRSGGKSLRYYASKLKYKLHFLSRYPSETVWGLVFWVWQWVWRKMHHYV